MGTVPDPKNSIPIMRSAEDFSGRVKRVVRRIPHGRTLTYGEVAERAGSPGAARAVGSVMKRNFDPAVPCHRVIRSDGRPGGYNRGGEERKRKLLEAEHRGRGE